MLSCDDARPQLGLLLSGALASDTLESLLDHLEGCAHCGIELAELQALEESLRALGPEPARRLPWRWLAAAALLLLAVGWGLAIQTAPQARLQAGLLCSDAASFRPGQPLPYRQALRAQESAAVQLAGGSQLALQPAAHFTLQQPRRLRLDSGVVLCDVTPGVDTFVVETPLGEVLVHGTSFQVAVEERTVGETGIKLAIAVTVVTVAVISGVVLFKLSSEEGPRWQLDDGDSAELRTGDAVPRRLDDQVPVLQARLEEMQARLDSSEEKQRQASAQTEQLQTENASLQRALAAAQQELQQLRAAASQPAPTQPRVEVAAEQDPLAVDFGEWSELAELRDADWEKLGTAMQDLSADLIPRYVEALKAGTESRQLGIEVAKANSKLQSLALGLNGKLPTHSSGNGEYTHPIVLANLMVSHLEAAGEPLDEQQLARLQALGAAYDTSYRQTQQRYNESTYALQMAMDELELKAEFYRQQLENLNSSQRELLVHPEFLNLYGIDLYSPVLMAPIQDFARGQQPDAIRTRLRDKGGQRWKLSESDLEAVGTVFDTWLQQAGPLEPVQASSLSFVSLDEVIRAGRAQLQAMHDLVQLLGLDAEAETTLREDVGLLVPRLLAE